MTRLLFLFALALPLAAAQAPNPPPREPFWKKVLRIAGVSATPSQQKAPGEGPATGEVWVADVKSGARRKSSDGGFRSPVFAPGGRELLMVKGDALWRMAVSGGTPVKLFAVKGLNKLVGFDPANPDAVLGLVETERIQHAAMISLSNGGITLLPHDPNSAEDRKAVAHLKEWERVYGDTKLFVASATRPGLGGTFEWTEIMLRKGRGEPVNISRSDGVNCGQPSLSPDGTKVVFIRAAE